MRARVCASSVLPEPVGPTSRMLDLAISTSLFFCAVRQPLVVVVHRDREHLLGVVLADHVVVQDLADLLRRRHAVARLHQVRLVLLADDVHAQFDAFVADEHGRARRSACGPRAATCRRTSSTGCSSNRRTCSCALLPRIAGDHTRIIHPASRARDKNRVSRGNAPAQRRITAHGNPLCGPCTELTHRPGRVTAASAPRARRRPRQALLASSVGRRRAALDHLVHQAEIPGLLGRHVAVALQLALDRLDRLAGVA